MQKKTTFLVLAQVMCIAAFVLMACACASSAPSIPTVPSRVLKSSCIGPDYVFVGKFDTYQEAEQAAKAMGLKDVCYSEQYCFGK